MGVEPTGKDAHHGEAMSEPALRLPLPSIASGIPAGPTLCGLTLIPLLSSVLFIAMDLGHGIDSTPALSWMQCGGLFAATAVLLILCWPGEVVIGTDGVLMRETACSPFIRYAALEKITPDVRGVRLELKDGTVLLLRTPSPLVLARLRRAVALVRWTPHPRPAFELLDRGRRSLLAWRDDLRRLRVGPEDYRSATLSATDLGALIRGSGRSHRAADRSRRRARCGGPRGGPWPRAPRGERMRRRDVG